MIIVPGWDDCSQRARRVTGCLGHRAGSPLRKAAGILAVQRRVLELSATLASTALNTITAGYEPERPHSVRVPLKPKNYRISAVSIPLLPGPAPSNSVFRWSRIGASHSRARWLGRGLEAPGARRPRGPRHHTARSYPHCSLSPPHNDHLSMPTRQVAG